MTTSAEALQAVVDALAANMANGGYTQVRQEDTQASFVTGTEYANLLRTLTQDEVQAAIDAASVGSVQKYRAICG